VDETFGQVRVSRCVGCTRILLNAKTARSQIIGGAVYGMGYALRGDAHGCALRSLRQRESRRVPRSGQRRHPQHDRGVRTRRRPYNAMGVKASVRLRWSGGGGGCKCDLSRHGQAYPRSNWYQISCCRNERNQNSIRKPSMSKAENTSQQSGHNHTERFYETYYATWNNRRRGGAFGLATLAASRGVFANTLQPVKPGLARQILTVDSNKVVLITGATSGIGRDNGGGFRP